MRRILNFLEEWLTAGKTGNERFAEPVGYYRETILERLEQPDIKHPNIEIWFRNEIFKMSTRKLGTRAVLILDDLQRKSRDLLYRKYLVRLEHRLRIDYLNSFREYSDRALQLLSEREKYFDRWEGLFILGCFGTESSIPYLEQRLAEEHCPVIKETINRAKIKIVRNQKEKKRKRGF